MRCDVIAEGIVAAAREVGVGVPLVVRLEGTNVEHGKQILGESGLAITAGERPGATPREKVVRGAWEGSVMAILVDRDTKRACCQGITGSRARSTPSRRSSTAPRSSAASRRARAARTIDGMPVFDTVARRGARRPAPTRR